MARIDSEKKAGRDAAVKNRLSGQGIEGRRALATFENFAAETDDQKKALEICMVWSAKPEGFLLLLGEVGTGKGHMAASIIRVTGGSFVTASEIVRNIRGTFSKQADLDEEQSRIDAWGRKPVLALDDIGVQKGSDFEGQILHEILDKRYVLMLPTIMTANLNLRGVGEYLGARVMDRIAEKYQVVIFDWPSHRRKTP